MSYIKKLLIIANYIFFLKLELLLSFYWNQFCKMDQYKMKLLYHSIVLWCHKERSYKILRLYFICNRNTLQLFYFIIYAPYLMVLRLYLRHIFMYNNSNNNVKRAMSEIFNSLCKGFSLDAAWRNWHASSRRIVSGTARSKDNENNRHLFLSSVVSSILRTVCRSTYESWPLSFCLYICIHTHKLKSLHSTRVLIYKSFLPWRY